MPPEHQAILHLLRKALCPSAALNVPSGINWKRFIRLAHEQGVLGVCFSAVESLPTEQRPGFEELMDWIGRVEFQKKVYEKQRKAIAELAAFYSDHGIRMMLLKGYGLSLNYPTPELRPGGDIDIYLGGKWKEADLLIQDTLGIKVDKEHHHHTCFIFRGFSVENHYDFINVHAHRDAQKIEDKLKQLAAMSAEESKIPNLYFPSADFNALFLLRHMGQHFAGEKVTLRQLLDWHLFLKHHSGKVHWGEIDRFLVEIGLFDFKEYINHICRYCFDDPSTALTGIEERILHDVLSPEFGESGSGILFKWKRWKANIWKHRIVYSDSLTSMLFTLIKSHLIKPHIA